VGQPSGGVLRSPRGGSRLSTAVAAARGTIRSRVGGNLISPRSPSLGRVRPGLRVRLEHRKLVGTTACRPAGRAAHACVTSSSERAVVTQRRVLRRPIFVNFVPRWALPNPMHAHIPLLVGAAGTETNSTGILRICRRLDHQSARTLIPQTDAGEKLLSGHSKTMAAACRGRRHGEQSMRTGFKPVPEVWRHWRTRDRGVIRNAHRSKMRARICGALGLNSHAAVSR